MKKSILILCAGAIISGLTAFTFLDWNTAKKCNSVNSNSPREENLKSIQNKKDVLISDVYFNVSPRFDGIGLSQTHSANSMEDFLTQEEIDAMVEFKSLSVIVIENDQQSAKREIGNSRTLTKGQKKLLRSFNYSSNFQFRADYVGRNKETGELEDKHYGPHLTVVPEKQAIYEHGNDVLINYIRENMEDQFPVADIKMLRPTIIYFTINTEGKISKINQTNTSGYPSIDSKLNALIRDLKGNWTPAENEKGEKIEQELTLMFAAGGC